MYSMDIDSIVEQIHRLLLDNLPVKTSRTPSGWITLNCPMCNDKRKRGGIITDSAKISYNCFNCGFKTGWTPGPSIGKKYKELVKKLGATDKEVHQLQLELLKHSNEFEQLEESEYVYSVAKFEKKELPENVQTIESLPEEHELRQYAQARGLLGVYPLLHFSDIANRRRIIVPFTYNGDVVGWTGRHVAPPDKNTPKYLLNTQPGYVFNVDKFVENEREIVIVTEGIFDAILVDGVSVLGNTVTAEQAHLIDKLNKRVILCPDRDKAGKKLIKQAVELGWEVSFPPWAPDIKDAADAVNRYGRLATIHSIIHHSTANKIKIEVKAKMI